MITSPSLWIDNNVQSQITFEIEQRVQSWFGVEARLNKSPRQRLYRHSFFLSYQVNTPDRSVTILVKIARKPSINRIDDAVGVDELRAIAQTEYSFLKTTWDAFERAQKPGFYAVQPLAYLDEWNAIVMRKADGESLNRLFFTPAIPFGLPGSHEKLVKVLKQAGQWLKLFHLYAGELKLDPFPCGDVKKEAEQLFESLSTNSANQIDAQGLKEGVLGLISRLNDEALTARLHGDYHFSNILYTSDGQLCALDPFYSIRNPIYEDVAELLVHPVTRPVQFLTNGRFAPQQLVIDCQKAVLDGYFDDVLCDQNMLNLYCALHIVHQWSMNEKKLQRTGMKQTLLRPVVIIMRRYFKRALAQYIPEAA